jgi:hypothetical protein
VIERMGVTTYARNINVVIRIIRSIISTIIKATVIIGIVRIIIITITVRIEYTSLTTNELGCGPSCQVTRRPGGQDY